MRGRHHRVDHCQFSGQRHSGVTVVVWVDEEPDFHLLDHNLFSDRPRGNENGFETIRIGTSDVSLEDSRTTVESNYFEKCNGEIEAISNKSCGNIYRFNTFVELEGTLTLRHGNRCRVEANFFLGRGAEAMGGVRVIGEDHVVVNNYFADLKGTGMSSALCLLNGLKDSAPSGYFAAHRARVAFNTFVDCAQPLVIGYDKGGDLTIQPTGVELENNLVKSGKAPLVTQKVPAANVRYAGNLLFGADLGVSSTAGLRVEDPALEKGADGLFRPSARSPAIDAAAPSPLTAPIDLDGRERDGKADLGAFESTPGPAHLRLLTPDDVGPSFR